MIHDIRQVVFICRPVSTAGLRAEPTVSVCTVREGLSEQVPLQGKRPGRLQKDT